MYPVDLFYRQAGLTPEATAVEQGELTLTYAELDRSSRALAAALQSIDSRPGSRVGICCFNHAEHVIAWLAVLAASKVWVPLYPGNAASELSRSVSFTGMTIVIADPEARHLVDINGVTLLETGEHEANTISRLIRDNEGRTPRHVHQELGATQAIKFTGGSTGTPKGVMQTFRSWNAVIATTVHAWDLRADDRFLAAAPLTHGTSTYLLPTLATGGTLVLMDRGRPADVLARLSNGAITSTFLPPTLIYMMMREPLAGGLRFDALRNLIYGSAPMRPIEIESAQRMFGPCLASTYGQTEAPQIATMISAEDLLRADKRASVGRQTFLARVGIIDPEGRELAAGEVGEIAIRGDLVMSGYWNQPERTSEAVRGGWLYTGDLGSFDDEGFLFIKGRSKDIVITGGFNVYPADVEPVLGEADAVVDCAVFGVPDDKWGEALHAAVQLAPGVALDEAALMAEVRARLGSVKTPKSITAYDVLPRNALGKLQKQALVDDHLAAAGCTSTDQGIQ